jgi:hypothetical protein
MVISGTGSATVEEDRVVMTDKKINAETRIMGPAFLIFTKDIIVLKTDIFFDIKNFCYGNLPVFLR